MPFPRIFPRICALQPSISVTLAALGKLEHLAACTRWCVDQVPELAGHPLTILPDSWSVDDAAMAALPATQVDLVLASVPYRMESLAAILKQGTPVLALAPRSLEEIHADTRMIASLVAAQAEAEGMVQQMQTELSRVAAQVAGRAKVRIYCEEWGKPLIHSQPWVYELAAACGGEPVGVPGSRTSAEAVAEADPDVLLLAWCGAGDRVPLERVVAQRGWQQLRAVREGRVYCVPDEFLNTPALPSLTEGLACMAHCLQPGEFPAPPRVRNIAPVQDLSG